MGKLRHITMPVSDARKTAAFDKSVAAFRVSVKPIRDWPQGGVGGGAPP
jgi:hypothetical protein